MKVVILAGGFGTRLSEETDIKPKPMVEIGGMPISEKALSLFLTKGLKPITGFSCTNLLPLQGKTSP